MHELAPETTNRSSAPYTARAAQATISRIRHLIRTLSYVVSTHAAEELEDDNLSVLDLENIVLTGQIIER